MDTVFEFELTERDKGLIFAHFPTKHSVRIKEKIGRVEFKGFKTIIEFDEDSGLPASPELTELINIIFSRRFING